MAGYSVRIEGCLLAHLNDLEAPSSVRSCGIDRCTAVGFNDEFGIPNFPAMADGIIRRTNHCMDIGELALGYADICE